MGRGVLRVRKDFLANIVYISPTTVTLSAGEASLPCDCAALAHQITTIDRSKLIAPRIGRLSTERVRELEKAYLSLHD